MSWVKIISGVVQLIGWITRYISKKEIEENTRTEVELERRDEQDRIRDDIRNTDPNSVSDDEIISR